MKITILCVGKIKENYLRMGIDEYLKRLSRYCKMEIIEVADEKTPDRASLATEDKIRKIEGERLLKNIKETDYVIALAIEGQMPDSVALAAKIEKLGMERNKSVILVIGGSLGLSTEVLKRSNEKISFSKLTFPHQLMRMILLEQIYRAFRIIHKEPYHK